jgi:hypothetical protein
MQDFNIYKPAGKPHELPGFAVNDGLRADASTYLRV